MNDGGELTGAELVKQFMGLLFGISGQLILFPRAPFLWALQSYTAIMADLPTLSNRMQNRIELHWNRNDRRYWLARRLTSIARRLIF